MKVSSKDLALHAAKHTIDAFPIQRYAASSNTELLCQHMLAPNLVLLWRHAAPIPYPATVTKASSVALRAFQFNRRLELVIG